MQNNSFFIATAALVGILIVSGCGGNNTTTEGKVVSGTIDFDGAVVPENLTRARVVLTDVSLADAAGEVINEVSIAPIDEIPVEFAIPYSASEIESTHQYAIQAEVFEFREGEMEVRAYLTTQSYPVLTSGFPDNVNLLVERLD